MWLPTGQYPLVLDVMRPSMANERFWDEPIETGPIPESAVILTALLSEGVLVDLLLRPILQWKAEMYC